MKQLFAFLAIAGIMAACNEKAESKQETKDSSATTISPSTGADSISHAVDSLNKLDSTKK